MRAVTTIAALAALSMMLLSERASAAQHRGRIAIYHLNSEIQGRGVCIQMTPALPNTWACLWKDNELYTEITQLFLHAMTSRAPCIVTWNSPDPHGWHRISIAECRN